MSDSEAIVDLLVFGGGMRAHRQHEEMPPPWALEHAAQDLQPVHVGKVHVEEDEIGLALLRDRKRFPSGSRHPDLESRRHEDSLRQEDVHRLIIDDQDAWGFEGRHPWCLFAHRWFNRWMLNLLVLPR